MIQDKTIDETLVELARTMKALQALRAARKCKTKRCYRGTCELFGVDVAHDRLKCQECNEILYEHSAEMLPHASVKRASMDLTRALAKLRASK